MLKKNRIEFQSKTLIEKWFVVFSLKCANTKLNHCTNIFHFQFLSLRSCLRSSQTQYFFSIRNKSFFSFVVHELRQWTLKYESFSQNCRFKILTIYDIVWTSLKIFTNFYDLKSFHFSRSSLNRVEFWSIRKANDVSLCSSRLCDYAIHTFEIEKFQTNFDHIIFQNFDQNFKIESLTNFFQFRKIAKRACSKTFKIKNAYVIFRRIDSKFQMHVYVFSLTCFMRRCKC